MRQNNTKQLKTSQGKWKLPKRAPKLSQNYPKRPKATQNNLRGDLNWTKTTQNESKLPKTSQKMPKLTKTRQKDPKQNLDWSKTIKKMPKRRKATQKEN